MGGAGSAQVVLRIGCINCGSWGPKLDCCICRWRVSFTGFRGRGGGGGGGGHRGFGGGHGPSMTGSNAIPVATRRY